MFAVLAMSLSYYKTFKVSNVITHAIEKYEGYNELAEKEILSKISSLGYNITSVNCKNTITDGTDTCKSFDQIVAEAGTIPSGINHYDGDMGYCIYRCATNTEGYYHYKISTNMLLNMPLLNNFLKFPVYNNSANIYDFEGNF